MSAAELLVLVEAEQARRAKRKRRIERVAHVIAHVAAAATHAGFVAGSIAAAAWIFSTDFLSTLSAVGLAVSLYCGGWWVYRRAWRWFYVASRAESAE